MNKPFEKSDDLLLILKHRFECNIARHSSISWGKVESVLKKYSCLLATLRLMEDSGGEPDVVEGIRSSEYFFYDCSPESPLFRRNLCYDQQALDLRKQLKPQDSAIGVATAMGVELLTEEEYRHLQSYGQFDQKTSSWLKTPDLIRSKGGAIFGDRRFDTVFVYHNGAESYYGSRGFRAKLRILSSKHL